MKKELLQEYTVRLSQCNRSQLVVIMYEIILEYLKEAREAFAEGRTTEFVEAVKRAQNFVAELIHMLDFKYEISMSLFRVYLYWNQQLVQAIVKKDSTYLDGLDELVQKLHDSFEKVSKEDTSAPLMKNTQKVYAGLTYGKQSLSEMTDIDYNRGFQA